MTARRTLVALAFVPTLSCTSRNLVVSIDQQGCTDWNPENPDIERIEVDQTDLAVTIIHTGDMAACDAVFNPTVSASHKHVDVHEYWLSDTGASDCEVCYAPSVKLKNPDPGKWEVSWYLDDAANPLDTVEFEVK